MPDRNQFPVQVSSAEPGAQISNCFPSDRTSTFSYATLRSILKTSLLGNSMARQKPTNADASAPAISPGPVSPAAGTFFLRTKLLPPRPAPEILARPRLIERLRANLALPVTLVTANAGSG